MDTERYAKDLNDRSIRRTKKHVYEVRTTLTRFAAEFAAKGVAPGDMHRSIMSDVLEEYRATGRRDQSVQQVAVKFMALYTWAFEEEIFARDKLTTFKKPPVGDKSKHQLVTLEEIGRIVRAVIESWSPEHASASRFRSTEARVFFSTRDKCMTLWMPETGMRIGETCCVTLDALDLEARTIWLEKTKNGDERVAILTQQFVDGPLAEWLAIRTGLEALTDRLFISERGLPLNPYTWGRQWNKYVERAGIGRRIRRHDMRHFILLALDNFKVFRHQCGECRAIIGEIGKKSVNRSGELGERNGHANGFKDKTLSTRLRWSAAHAPNGP